LRLECTAIDEEQEMPRTANVVILLGTIALLTAAELHAQESGGVARCADIDNGDARLACYDEVARRSAPSQPANEATAEEQTGAAKGSEPLPLTQEVGAEQLDSKIRPEQEPERFQGRVVECKQDASKKWYFYFDNGQVWKQRANARLTNRECDFAVTLTKDSFGYKMQIEGETKKFRVGRIR
jgi:hypothetical protein